MQAANDAIGRIAGTLPPGLQEDRLLLQADILLALSDYAGAARVLAGMTDHPRAGRYARFNLASRRSAAATPRRTARRSTSRPQRRPTRNCAACATGPTSRRSQRAAASASPSRRGCVPRAGAPDEPAVQQGLLGYGWPRRR